MPCTHDEYVEFGLEQRSNGGHDDKIAPAEPSARRHAVVAREAAR
jgi:hypothetical protein